MSKEIDQIEVEWNGKKLLLSKEKLDEWHAMATDEQRVDYINSHHEYRHSGDPIGVYRMSKTDEHRGLQEPDDLVLVHWSGVKVKRIYHYIIQYSMFFINNTASKQSTPFPLFN
jgi:hypothetical protein